MLSESLNYIICMRTHYEFIYSRNVYILHMSISIALYKTTATLYACYIYYIIRGWFSIHKTQCALTTDSYIAELFWEIRMFVHTLPFYVDNEASLVSTLRSHMAHTLFSLVSCLLCRSHVEGYCKWKLWLCRHQTVYCAALISTANGCWYIYLYTAVICLTAITSWNVMDQHLLIYYKNILYQATKTTLHLINHGEATICSMMIWLIYGAYQTLMSVPIILAHFPNKIT